jgi:hypothetical protein
MLIGVADHTACGPAQRARQSARAQVILTQVYTRPYLLRSATPTDADLLKFHHPLLAVLLSCVGFDIASQANAPAIFLIKKSRSFIDRDFIIAIVWLLNHSYFLRISISTRRFRARPSSVELSATGRRFPKPTQPTRDLSIPFAMR